MREARRTLAARLGEGVRVLEGVEVSRRLTGAGEVEGLLWDGDAARAACAAFLAVRPRVAGGLLRTGDFACEGGRRRVVSRAHWKKEGRESGGACG